MCCMTPRPNSCEVEMLLIFREAQMKKKNFDWLPDIQCGGALAAPRARESTY